MKNLFYSNFNHKYTDLTLLLLRIIIGFEMGFYGLGKLHTFSTDAGSKFWATDVNFLGLGGSVSLSLTIFSELFCSIFLIVGLLTRVSLIPLIFTMLYIVVVMDHVEILSFEDGGIGINSAFKFLVFYTILFIAGPGKYSLDYRFFRV